MGLAKRDATNVTRRTLFSVALIAGLFIAGALCAVGVDRWIGVKQQHAQLERCVRASRHSHPHEDARSLLTHLEAEVPMCMDGAGYERALGNENCGAALWQGDVFCYLPKSLLGKLVYRIETSSHRQRSRDDSKAESARES
jgi:hypothetical protein